MGEKSGGEHGKVGGDDETREDDVRVWLVERTYSDDEQNLIILVYSTLDGERYFRKERALPSFTGSARQTFAGLDVSPDQLGTVTDDETRERYATEAQRIASEHDQSDPI
ncbi:hypothetical protein SAMN05421858_2622 [Haladaptatus litoreus]|uniref:DUF7967 domain-containing protein n=1 Tax=Haladaptatus litoreus TaxID=553468 RepID=A0A1N7BLL9_9EURY|nr:hypothetical protein [Haladaptatus litoreus]SIR52103.1 hypothetical protein SAMN05421858_2622 [Haladaptatus litoreus]